MRYHGQGYEIPVALDAAAVRSEGLGDLEERFNALHEQLYGFRMHATASEIVNLRAIGNGSVQKPELPTGETDGADPSGAVVEEHAILFEGENVPTRIYDRSKLSPGARIPGPAVDHGVRLDHGGAARLHGRGRHPLQPPHQPRGVSMAATEELRIAAIPTDVEIDPVTLDIIEGALKSARYEMDAVLFRSAMSPVIREQHDEFPMLTDPRGRMVVGQFGAYINEMMEEWTRGIYPGDVILCADPFKCSASISHTNDWLVLVPIFFEDELVGWASQFGHMMDAGGPLPGRAADGRQDDLRRGHHHPADQGRRARRRAGGRARADPQQRAHPGDEPGRPVRDHRRLPRRRGARDGALQPLRQAHLPGRPAGAARPHATRR